MADMNKIPFADQLKAVAPGGGLFGRTTLSQKLLIPIAVIAFVLLGISSFITYRDHLNDVRTEARIAAKVVQRQLEADRGYYAGNVVRTALEAGLEVAEHYRQAETLAIPLPATYVREVSEKLNESARDTDYNYTLRSLYPINPKKGPRNEIERRFMEINFRQGIEQEGLTRRNGRLFYTLYVPDFAGVESCASCHNEREGAIKKDYQDGDVMGSLVINVPIEDGLNSAVVETVAQIGLFALILIVAGGVFYPLSRRVVLSPMNRLVKAAAEVAAGNLTVQVKAHSNDEVGQLVGAFNTMTAQLRQTIGDLKSRTQQLESIAEINRRLVGILDVDELLSQVVTLVKETYDYNHVHIYLLDEGDRSLRMAEGTGETGAEMKRLGHRIPLEASRNLVARVARQGQVIATQDLFEDPAGFTGSLMPGIRSEMAVPVIARGEVIGVLDVHSEKEEGASYEDAVILQILTNQVAVALRNAQRFEETSQALAEAKKIQQLYLEHSWQAYLNRQKVTTYQEVLPDAAPVDDNLLAQIKQKTTQGETVVATTPSEKNGDGAGAQSALAVPLVIRDQIIGTIRIHDTGNRRHWTSEEIALMEAIGEQMSLAIENARLFEDTQQQASRELLTREITDKMRAVPDVEAIIETGLSELRKVLGVSHTYVKLTNVTEEER